MATMRFSHKVADPMRYQEPLPYPADILKSWKSKVMQSAIVTVRFNPKVADPMGFQEPRRHPADILQSWKHKKNVKCDSEIQFQMADLVVPSETQLL